MGRSPYQIYKVVTPVKNEETGEICEDLICIKCNTHVNEETGEVEEKQKELFKIPIQQELEAKKKNRTKTKCEMCKHGKHSLIFLLVTLSLLLPTFTILFYICLESFFHTYIHKANKPHHKRAQNIRNKLHCLFYSEFCAFCQSEKCMDRVSKLQDERMARMRKYVKNIPIQ